MNTYYKRVSLYGYSHEEACLCPTSTPLWMYRIEQREGRTVRDMLAEGAAAASQTGYTLSDYAREWGVSRSTMEHWSRKWGIRWPRGASAVQREKARQNAMRMNERRSA